MTSQKTKNGKPAKSLLGIGEYGAWEVTLLPNQLSEEGEYEKIWVFARSLSEIAENIPGVESAVFLGKATCIADTVTPGMQESTQDLIATINDSIPASIDPGFHEHILQPSNSRACPFCRQVFPLNQFTKPKGIAETVNVVACPNCAMLTDPKRLIMVKV